MPRNANLPEGGAEQDRCGGRLVGGSLASLLADSVAAFAGSHVEVQVIGVSWIGAWTEHRGEIGAGARSHGLLELRFW